MKKLTKKSSSQDSQQDPNRSALFGKRNGPSETSPQPPQPSQPRDPYRQRQQTPNRNPYSQDHTPYARDPYATRDPYASRNPQPPRPAPGPRGYSDESQDSSRNALFGNRAPYNPREYGTRTYDAPSEPDRYDEYQQQAENSDEDVEAVKQEIRFTKQESLSSTRNAIRIASEAEEQGRNTLTRLGAQSEKLAGVEKNLDVSAAYATVAEDKARELKTLNRSIFAVHMSNPFTSKSRAEEEERKIKERHEMERQEREANRKYAYDSTQRVNSALNKPGTGRKPLTKETGRSTIAQRSQFSFEEDDEDIQMEKDIDANLNTLGDITSRLKGLALASQSEIDSQNRQLDQITDKVISFFWILGC